MKVFITAWIDKAAADSLLEVAVFDINIIVYSLASIVEAPPP